MLENLKISSVYDGFLFLAEGARNAAFLFRDHHHVELELNLVIRGEITYIVDGKRYTFNKRTLLWFFPTQEHQLVHRSSEAEYYISVFTPEMIQNACRGERYKALAKQNASESGILHTVLEPEKFDLVRRTMDAMVVDGLDKETLNREAGFGMDSDFEFSHHDPDWLNASLRHLLLLCWRMQLGRPTNTQAVALHPGVKKAMKIISDADCLDDLGHLARKCNLSQSYLSRLFNQQVGLSISQYRNCNRLNRFWEHFRNPRTLTILEAVYAAGFGSYPQFFRVFTDTYGLGPNELQKKFSKPKEPHGIQDRGKSC